MSRSPDSRISTERRAFPCIALARIAAQWLVPVGTLPPSDSPLTVAGPCGIPTHFPGPSGRRITVGVYRSRPASAMSHGGPG